MEYKQLWQGVELKEGTAEYEKHTFHARKLIEEQLVPHILKNPDKFTMGVIFVDRNDLSSLTAHDGTKEM